MFFIFKHVTSMMILHEFVFRYSAHSLRYVMEDWIFNTNTSYMKSTNSSNLHLFQFQRTQFFVWSFFFSPLSSSYKDFKKWKNYQVFLVKQISSLLATVEKVLGEMSNFYSHVHEKSFVHNNLCVNRPPPCCC